jgi:7-keto-8-aminopelargonate synthetase-like enzyme
VYQLLISFRFRYHHISLTGEEKDCLNLASYNYLGFAETHGPIADSVEESIRTSGIATASPRNEGGNIAVVQELEQVVANFVGKPAGMLNTVCCLHKRGGVDESLMFVRHVQIPVLCSSCVCYGLCHQI